MASSLRKIVRHELVEIVIPANSTSTRFSFPDLPNIRNVHILGMSIYSSENYRLSIQSLTPVLAQAQTIQDCFVTLVNYGGKEFLHQAPAINFHTIQRQTAGNQYDYDVKMFTGQKVNYPKSYIQFTTAPATANNQVFLCSIWYSLPVAEERVDADFDFRNKG
jgi:hypothetical protein